MVEVEVSTSLVPEFNYSCKIIFELLLGINYRVILREEGSDIFVNFNGSSIVMPGDFWKKDGYLSKEHLPNEITFANGVPRSNGMFPVIYGKNVFTTFNRNVYCGLDIFASVFFMLTRWEEYVSEVRDFHGRFPGALSLASRNGFLKRPVVNEYCDLLWEFLKILGYTGCRKQHNFTIIPTHDIDQVYYWNSTRKKNLVKNLSGDIIRRRNFTIMKNRLRSYLNYTTTGRDPDDTFCFLMDKAEENNTRAFFYFISGGITAYDNSYSVSSEDVRASIDEILKRGHQVGIHPSYNSYKDAPELENEINVLSILTRKIIIEGRNHYLRFDMPETFRLLQDAGIRTDSSLYYSDTGGFRCGICKEFPVFDFLKREEMLITERPLIVMDTMFSAKDPEWVLSEINNLKNKVKHHGGEFVFLWHNNNINSPEWRSYKEVFETAFYGS